MVAGTPFTIYEVEFALWQVDLNGAVVGGQIFVGGAAEKMTLGGEFASRLIQYQGVRDSQDYHEDEVHMVELQGVVYHKKDGGIARVSIPSGLRNRRCALIVLFYDAAAGWVKLTYSGVTVQPAKVEGLAGGQGAVVMQTLRMRAERVETKAGFGGKPTLTPVKDGEIRFIGNGENVAIYRYDVDLLNFVVVDQDLLVDRAEIDLSTADELSITIDGELALKGTTDEIMANDFIGTGQTFSDEQPRIEFWANGRRRGSLTKTGVLVVPDFQEANADPGGADVMSFKNGATWLFTIGQKCLAPNYDQLP